MPSTTRSTPTTTRVARISYLNSAPFFEGLALGARYALLDCVPKAIGLKADAGEIDAGLLPVWDFLRLRPRFEPLGRSGIAVHGRVRSVLLFSLKPIRQLEGARIAVTDETSTSAVLLRLLLERRYRVYPAAYEVLPPRTSSDADALLLIGDEALRFQRTNAHYPFEIDLAFEWWLWQHLPCVFALWAVRSDVVASEKKSLEAALARALAINSGQLAAIAAAHAGRLGVPAEDLAAYLGAFHYRFGPEEARAIETFAELAHAHHLL